MSSIQTINETISQVATLFYQLKVDEGVKQLAGLTELIVATLKEYETSDEDLQHVQDILNECMTAYQHKEYIVLADLLQYELAQIFAL
jgi:hypothetical protein